MSLSDIFNFILDIFKFIWNLDLIWFAVAIGVLILFAFIAKIFEVVTEALTNFYESNPKYAFYLRWMIAIPLILFFLSVIIIILFFPS